MTRVPDQRRNSLRRLPAAVLSSLAAAIRRQRPATGPPPDEEADGQRHAEELLAGGESATRLLTHSVDNLESYIGHVGAQVRRSESNRLSLLHLHAAAACYIAVGFALIPTVQLRTPTFALIRLIPGVPVSLAALFGVGGAILAVATVRRNLGWEIAGLSLMLAWYVIVAVSFGGAVLLWLADGRQGATPSFYAHGVYLHLAVIMTVHLLTLRRIQRARLVEDGR